MSEEYVLPAPQPKPIPQETLTAIALATSECIKRIRKDGMANKGGKPTDFQYNAAIEAAVSKILEVTGNKDALKS